MPLWHPDPCARPPPSRQSPIGLAGFASTRFERLTIAAHDFAFDTVWRGIPSDASYAAVEARYGKASALDILAICGYYTLLAFVLNTEDFPLPEGSSRLEPIAAASLTWSFNARNKSLCRCIR